jgi:HlyD family secretion protein
VEVLEGLTDNEEVITGSQKLSTAVATEESSGSPFMPKRPGGNNKKK